MSVGHQQLVLVQSVSASQATAGGYSCKRERKSRESALYRALHPDCLMPTTPMWSTAHRPAHGTTLKKLLIITRRNRVKTLRSVLKILKKHENSTTSRTLSLFSKSRLHYCRTRKAQGNHHNRARRLLTSRETAERER